LKHLLASNRFKKELKKLPSPDQEKTLNVLKGFLGSLNQQKPLSEGYGFKKIGENHYELRVDLKLRIVMRSEENNLICHLIGNHDNVEKYLKDYGNK